MFPQMLVTNNIIRSEVKNWTHWPWHQTFMRAAIRLAAVAKSSGETDIIRIRAPSAFPPPSTFFSHSEL
jgi:hypothetical protein